jgi:hypothetical protein
MISFASLILAFEMNFLDWNKKINELIAFKYNLREPVEIQAI